jgi:hypothetical protein
MECSQAILCLTEASSNGSASFFGFAEFIGVFALLVIVFTIADVQYRFRISVAPIPLPKITFWAIAVIGFGTLAADVWISQGWLVVYVPWMTLGVIQGIFAALFLATAMAWIYFAFLSPPVFSKRNAEKYGKTLFTYLLRGSESELPVIAMEVSRSAANLVEIFKDHQSEFHKQLEREKRGEKAKWNPGNYASDIMRMIGNRKFCRYVVAYSPSTAIRIFQALKTLKVYDSPLGQFAKNVSTEAILNRDSNLYHEDSHYKSGLFGELKPFTKSVYGSYKLVESLGRYHASPLDVDYELSRDWNASRLRVYARAVLTTYRDMLDEEKWHKHSYTITRAFNEFNHACRDIYTLDGLEDRQSDVGDRLDVVADFIKDLVSLLKEYEVKINPQFSKFNRKRTRWDIYDNLANLMSEVIYNASGISKPWWPCWHIQHNIVWSSFFDSVDKSKTRKILTYKLRRIIYEEIIEFDKYADLKSFKSARYLGIALNCMGLNLGAKSLRNRNTEPLKKFVLGWVKKNYLSLHKVSPTVAEACLMCRISFDSDKNQLVKTYASHADRRPQFEILQLTEVTGPIDNSNESVMQP